jgi:peroxiredoxin
VLVHDADPRSELGGTRDVELSPVLHGAGDFDRLVRWVGTTLIRLQDRLDRVRTELRQSLIPSDRAALGAAIERLQMLQIVETSLAVGDVVPDFALPDRSGRIVASEALLAKGPMVLAFVRGTWCPYCSLALQALDAARPPIEALGGSLVVISPLRADELARAAADRGLGLTLLSDADGDYASLCGVHYEMSEGHVALYQRFGLDLAQINAGAGWALPIPATYVVGRDGVVTFAYAEVDWARRAEPADILAAVEGLDRAASPG